MQAKYGIHPFWFWNGDMEESQVTRQIKEMKNKGVGGFFICARQGLTIPYLSDEWFRRVKVALDAAVEENLDVWLYDEYPYPSGVAGGEVILEHPDAKHCTLEHRVFHVSGGETIQEVLPWARVLSAKAVPVDDAEGRRSWEQSIDVAAAIGNDQIQQVFQKAGLTAYNQKRFFTYETAKKIYWTAPEGQWEVHVFLEQEVKDFKYYGTFVDPCHPEAVKTFMKLTHERYAKELGSYFGRPIKGMFTDETAFLGKWPWTPQLVEYFRETWGYEITDVLAQLLYGEGENPAKVRYDYFQSLHTLLRERYHKPLHDWCEQHGLQYVAEVPGIRMTTQMYSHVPGGDTAHEKLGRRLQWILDEYTLTFRANCKMVSSLSRQLGRERALIECFHSIGWSMTLQDARWMIDRMAAMGINFFNFHAFFYTLDGLRKHDAPPSHFLQNPYWKHFEKLGDYTTRISELMTRGEAQISVAMLDATTSLWTHMGNPLIGFPYIGLSKTEEQRLDKLKRDWARLSHTMLTQRRDFDHLDPEMLSQAVIQDGVIRVGKATYTVLVLPPMTNIETFAWRKIEAFIAQGGAVIACGLLPYEDIEDQQGMEQKVLEVFGLTHSPKSSYWQGTIDGGDKHMTNGKVHFIHDISAETLVPLLEQHAPQAIQLYVEDDPKTFLMQHRKTPEQTSVIFVTNQEGGHHHAELMVDSDHDMLQFVKLDLETGCKEPLSAIRKEHGWSLPLEFAPYESHVIEISQEAKPSAKAKKSWIWNVEAQTAWEMKADRENIVRLDHFDIRMDDHTIATRVQAKTFIDQCADLVESPPVRYDQIFGTPMHIRPAYPIDCQFRESFVVHYLPEDCYLLMDRGAISGDFEMKLNGHPITTEDFVSREVYDHANVACDISAMLVKGNNTLTIDVKIAHDWDGVVDAIYVMGNFGVLHDDQQRSVISVPETQGILNRGPYPGLPYYAGSVTFTREVNLKELPDTDQFELRFSDWDEEFHDCVEVFVNGHGLGVRPWTPYRWIGNVNLLQVGDNTITVKVTNTLIGMMEGKYFDYGSHTLKDVCEISALS